jgi:hypothetical protein
MNNTKNQNIALIILLVIAIYNIGGDAIRLSRLKKVREQW